MKTSEFIERVLEIDGVESVSDNYEVLLTVKDCDKGTLASVKTKEMYAIDTTYRFFSNLAFLERQELFSLLVEYGETPVGKREEPKKYKLKHKLVEDAYLNYFKDCIEDENKLRFSNSHETGSFKTEFTIQEWESLTEQTWEDLLLQFKAIEV